MGCSCPMEYSQPADSLSSCLPATNLFMQWYCWSDEQGVATSSRCPEIPDRYLSLPRGVSVSEKLDSKWLNTSIARTNLASLDKRNLSDQLNELMTGRKEQDHTSDRISSRAGLAISWKWKEPSNKKSSDMRRGGVFGRRTACVPVSIKSGRNNEATVGGEFALFHEIA